MFRLTVALQDLMHGYKLHNARRPMQDQVALCAAVVHSLPLPVD